MVSGKDPESSLLPIPSPPPKAVFVLGTDTNVGKTLVSSSIVGICLGMGMAVSYFKPAQTGVSSPDDPAGDAGLVLSQNRPHHFRAMTGYCFPDPIDPMTAAERVGALISRTDLLQKFHSLYREADMTVIEGAGGGCSPFFQGSQMALSYHSCFSSSYRNPVSDSSGCSIPEIPSYRNSFPGSCAKADP